MKTQLKDVLHSDRTKKEKFEYLKDYYGKAIIIGIVAIIAVVGISVMGRSNQKTVLTVGIYSANVTPVTDNLLKTANKELLKDPKKNTVVISSMNQQTLEKLYAMMSARDLDVLIADKKVYNQLNTQKAFIDLAKIVDKQTLSELKEKKLLYKNKAGVVTGIANTASTVITKTGVKNAVICIPSSYQNKKLAKKFLQTFLVID